VKSSFTYFGNYVIETIVDGDEVHYNMMPNMFPETGKLTEQETCPVDESLINVSEQPLPQEVVAPPLQTNITLSAEPPPSKVKPAASSGIKAGLASFGGMLAAGLLYVQQNFGSLTDISLKNIILIGGGAVLSGLLYFFYRFYHPSNPTQ
jgi:hypothetical protein